MHYTKIGPVLLPFEQHLHDLLLNVSIPVFCMWRLLPLAEI